MFPDPTAFYLVTGLIYLVVVTVVAYLLYTVVRLAVRKALRQHQEWLDSRS